MRLCVGTQKPDGTAVRPVCSSDCVSVSAEKALDLNLCVFNRIRAVNEVFGRTVAKISADCARSSVLKLGRTHQNAHAAHGVLALDHHRQHRAAGHIGNNGSDNYIRTNN